MTSHKISFRDINDFIHYINETNLKMQQTIFPQCSLKDNKLGMSNKTGFQNIRDL